jgi:hypothetical protein
MAQLFYFALIRNVNLTMHLSAKMTNANVIDYIKNAKKQLLNMLSSKSKKKSTLNQKEIK